MTAHRPHIRTFTTITLAALSLAFIAPVHAKDTKADKVDATGAHAFGGYDLRKLEHNSADYLHLLIESMRRSYADRSKYLGDPDFFDVPVVKLTAKSYVDILAGRGFNFAKDTNGKYKRSTLGRANAVMHKDGFFFGAADLRSPTSGSSGH